MTSLYDVTLETGCDLVFKTSMNTHYSAIKEMLVCKHDWNVQFYTNKQNVRFVSMTENVYGIYASLSLRKCDNLGICVVNVICPRHI